MQSADTKLVRTTTWIATTIAIVVAVTLPVGYFAIAYQYQVGALETEAEITASIVSRVINASPVTWHLQVHRLEDLLASRGYGGHPELRRIVNLRNELLVERSDAVRRPIIMRAANLLDSGVPVGRIEIGHSLVPLLGRMAGVGSLGLLLSVAVFIALRVLPLRALRGSEQRFHAVAQSANDAIVLTDAAGRVMSWNSAARALFRASDTEASGKPFSTFVAERSRDSYTEELERRRSPRLEGDPTRRTVDLWGLRKDGSEFPFEMSLSTWESGGNSFLCIIIRDITERKDLEATLRRAKNELEAVLASIGDGVCVTDAAGCVAIWNREAEQISGVPASALVGAVYPGSVREAYGERPVTEFSQTVIKRALDAGEAVSTAEAQLIQPDGTRIPVAATAAPIRNSSGAIVGCVNVFRDITREKEGDRMKSEFVSTVSHELRTPLTSIRAYAETLRDMVGEDATIQEFLRVIDEESERLSRLINQLLSLARIESGRIQFGQEPTTLEPLVARAIETARPKAAANSVQIHAEIPPGLPLFRGDGDAIGQVLVNLVDNAVKYNRRGGRVEVRARLHGGLVVEIRETGIVMPESAVRRLGERFVRVDSSETRRIGGTGLGLSLVKEIVAEHGARLEVQSQAGVGSVFRFVLPLAGGDT